MGKYIVITTLGFILMVVISCEKNHPRIEIQTEAGRIVVELYPDKAPITVSNFLKYVDNGRFNHAEFYRVVRPDNQPGKKVLIEVIQGGLEFTKKIDTIPGIYHETTDKTGLKHLNGTLSMARDKPGTASTEFFICIGNQPELDFGGKRNPDGMGFAAFGQVIEGLETVLKIQQMKDTSQYLLKRVGIKMKRLK
ncbi:MAG: peptidylprolyl isomerase [Bacteroidales bacterium]